MSNILAPYKQRPNWRAPQDSTFIMDGMPQRYTPAHKVKPANASMFKTSLYIKDQWATPDLQGLGKVQEALDRDYVSQCQKYGGSEPSPGMARFNVRLPSAPQNLKYSWLRHRQCTAKPLSFSAASPETCSTAATPAFAPSPFTRDASPRSSGGASNSTWSRVATGASSSSPTTGGHLSPQQQSPVDLPEISDPMKGVRFNMDRLGKWFRTLDKDDSGQITQREFIVHLRKNKELLNLFYRIMDIEDAQNGRRTSLNSSTSGGKSHQRRDLKADHREIFKIKEILSEVDTDGSGSMEWSEFVDFFRRAGLLLEYKTRSSLNRTQLCVEQEEAEAEEERRLNEIQNSKVSRLPTVTGKAFEDLQKFRMSQASMHDDDDEDEDEEDEESDS